MRNVKKAEMLTYEHIRELGGDEPVPCNDPECDECTISVVKCIRCDGTNLDHKFSLERQVLFIDCRDCPGWIAIDLTNGMQAN